MELLELIRQLEAEGAFDALTNSPDAQFGTPTEVFVGAGILPERGVPGNVVEEESLRYRPVTANDAARYSPVQLKEAAAQFGSMLAKLAESDIGKEFTAQMYDAVRRLILGGGSQEARARFLGWLDSEVSLALLRKNEIHRWNAIVDAFTTRIGDNGYVETVAYPDPDGHRRQVSADWEAVGADGRSLNDPFDDLLGIYEDARDAGVIFGRALMSTKTQFKLLRNTFVGDRAQFGAQGFVPPNDDVLRAPLGVPGLIAAFASVGLPTPEVYDNTYWEFDEDGIARRKRYLHDDKIVFIGQSGRSETYEPEDGEPFTVTETLGYTAIGTAAGQDSPGRIINVIPETRRKPPRIDCEGWQTSLPLILDGDLIFVLDTSAP